MRMAPPRAVLASRRPASATMADPPVPAVRAGLVTRGISGHAYQENGRVPPCRNGRSVDRNFTPVQAGAALDTAPAMTHHRTATDHARIRDPMPSLLFRSPSDPADTWTEALRHHRRDLEVRVWPDTGDPRGIEYALVWASPDGLLHELPDLRAVFSLGAGVDHLVHGEVPESVELVRMVDPALTEGMVEYVVYQVLRRHRRMDAYARQQARHEWHTHPQVRPGDRRVGILGLGEMGGACARALADLGFDVAGWARTHRELPGVAACTGDDGLAWLLGRSDILICLLPLTAATRGLLDAELFTRLPAGAAIINAARGEHLDEDALLVALGEGRIGHAVLDVFRREPLPPDHAFWHHPRIDVTPHMASLTNPWTGAQVVARAIEADRNGEPLPHRVDRGRGY